MDYHRRQMSSGVSTTYPWFVLYIGITKIDILVSIHSSLVKFSLLVTVLQTRRGLWGGYQRSGTMLESFYFLYEEGRVVSSGK